MVTKQKLREQRSRVETLRQQSISSTQQAGEMNESIASSWQRSVSAAIPKERSAAPLLTLVQKQPSALDIALQYCGNDLKHVAEQSSMVIAVGDVGSTIIWTAASHQMRSAAERVHFVEGGQWGEEMVGTNALALSIKTRQSSCVFSNEHYMQSVQDWVCYAAPIIDPHSRQLLGVIDLSTTWTNHNSLGILAAERCASIIQTALQEQQRQQIYIRAFSIPQVLFNGKNLVLTPRQIEILSILALCPQGLNLETLHQALYGERKVSMGTLKAEMSQLRDVLGGMLGSRPYRLLAHVEADFLQAEKALDAGYVSSALQLYTGVFLTKTESPFLCAWRDCLESRLSDAIFKAKETDMLLKHVARFPEAIDAVERLMELLPTDHPAHQSLIKYQQAEP
ncbi:transcriptional regulator [Acinetobacter guerrae]|uniref:Transcriptional regulator n=1 Tax=Acinetobacter guerrae TaxID=1843371 RepID=A0A3A8EKR4_9GAMM|nr:transcriptional regulator [Acinetobacter guerrae]RKG35507.1 transcriptional regulator [Acinetobacter guerrae]